MKKRPGKHIVYRRKTCIGLKNPQNYVLSKSNRDPMPEINI